MNKTRILGIILLIIGIYLFTLLYKYELGFLTGMVTGILLGIGIVLIFTGKFKF